MAFIQQAVLVPAPPPLPGCMEPEQITAITQCCKPWKKADICCPSDMTPWWPGSSVSMKVITYTLTARPRHINGKLCTADLQGKTHEQQDKSPFQLWEYVQVAPVVAERHSLQNSCGLMKSIWTISGSLDFTWVPLISICCSAGGIPTSHPWQELHITSLEMAVASASNH